jgi:hypothetical protein
MLCLRSFNFFICYTLSSCLLVKNTNKGEEHQQRRRICYVFVHSIFYPLSSFILFVGEEHQQRRGEGEGRAISLSQISSCHFIARGVSHSYYSTFCFLIFFPREVSASVPRALLSLLFLYSLLPCLNYFVNYSFLGSLYSESPKRETPLLRSTNKGEIN